MLLHCTHNSEFESEIDTFVVAIARLNPRYAQQHAGVIYRNSEGNLKLLDLQWHYCLSQSDPSSEFVWVDVPLDDLSKTHLAAVCEMIYEMNEDGVPYSISSQGASFLHNGEFLGEYKHSGFTCATFVLAVFHSQGFQVVDYSKWISRPSDKVWQRKIVQYLEHKSGATEEYIQEQRKKLEQGADRFRPEEVCAAVQNGGWPVGYNEIKKKSSDVLEYVVKHRFKLLS